MGSRHDRRRPSDRPALPTTQYARTVSTPGGHQRRARGRIHRRDHRLDAGRCLVRPPARICSNACCRAQSRRRGWRGQRSGGGAGARRRIGLAALRTRFTPRAQICCGVSVAPRSPLPPTNAPLPCRHLKQSESSSRAVAAVFLRLKERRALLDPRNLTLDAERGYGHDFRHG